MAETEAERERRESAEEERWDDGVDAVSILYVVGGIPAMVAFFVLLFVLVRIFPSIPA